MGMDPEPVGQRWDKPEFEYPYVPGDGRENMEAPDEVARVLRGGRVLLLEYYVRCAVRLGGSPGGRDWVGGFRVVASPISGL